MSTLTRQESLEQIIDFVTGPYASVTDRDEILETLPKMNDGEVTQLLDALRQQNQAMTDALNALNSMGDVVRASAETLTEPIKPAHPIAPLSAKSAFAAVRELLPTFLKDNVDVAGEFELGFALNNDASKETHIAPEDYYHGWLQAVRESEAPFGIPPHSVSDWIKRYGQAAPAGEHAAAARNEFVKQQHLNPSDERILLALLELYDYLLDVGATLPEFLANTTTTQPTRRELPKAPLAVPTEPSRPTPTAAPKASVPIAPTQSPRVTPAPVSRPTPTAPIAPPSQSTPPTAPSLVLNGEVAALVQDMKKETVPSRLQENLITNIQSRQLNATLAALRVMAEGGTLPEIVKQNSTLEVLLQTWYREQQRTTDLESLKLAPANPQHLKNFVRFLLENQLHLKENDSAHVAVDLINLANRSTGTKLQPWAYFDLSSNTYHWL